MIRKIIALALVLASVMPAVAHSWYPHDCCSDRDCYPVPVSDVKTVPGGWLVEGKTFVGYADARPSPDGKFHICRYQDGKAGVIRPVNQPFCFWAPQGAS